MEHYIKLNAELERLEKIANNRPEGMTEDLRKRFWELEFTQQNIGSLHNSIEHLRRRLNNTNDNIQKFRDELLGAEENIAKLESMIKRSNEINLGPENIRNAERMLEQARHSVILARENIEKYTKESLGKQDNINNLEKSLKEQIQQESKLRKEIEYIIMGIGAPMGGGGNDDEYWKQKYLKYKAKYLKLKIKL